VNLEYLNLGFLSLFVGIVDDQPYIN